MSNKYKTLIAFFLFLFLAIIRKPDFFQIPRIWAEEGLYYDSFINQSFFNFLIQPNLGYYSLVNKLIVLISSLFPLKFLPLSFTLLSFLFTMLVVLTPFIIKGKLWESFYIKILLSYFILTLSPSYTWLNFISLQFFFPIFIVFLFLSDPVQSKNSKAYIYSIFLLGCLTGVISLIFSSFLLISNSIKKSEFYTKLVYIFLFSLLIQIFSFVYCYITNDGYGHLDFKNLINIIDGFNNTLFYLVNPKFIQHYSRGINLLFKLTFIIYLYMIYRKNNKYLNFIIFSFLVISFLIAFLSLSMKSGPRYSYPISFFIVLVVFVAIKHSIYKNFSFLILIIIFLKSIDFYNFDQGYYSQDWKSFKNELKAFEQCNQDIIEIYPQNTNKKWFIHPMRNQLCK